MTAKFRNPARGRAMRRGFHQAVPEAGVLGIPSPALAEGPGRTVHVHFTDDRTTAKLIRNPRARAGKTQTEERRNLPVGREVLEEPLLTAGGRIRDLIELEARGVPPRAGAPHGSEYRGG